MTPAPLAHQRAILWLRRDLRSHDHSAWQAALKSSRHVWVVFVFDTHILATLPRADRRLPFIVQALQQIDADIRHTAQQGLALPTATTEDSTTAEYGLLVLHGKPEELIPALAAQVQAQAVFCSHDDEPYAKARDLNVSNALRQQNCQFISVKDHVIFERQELLTGASKTYSVYTPYWRSWSQALRSHHIVSRDLTHTSQQASISFNPEQPNVWPHDLMSTAQPAAVASEGGASEAPNTIYAPSSAWPSSITQRWPLGVPALQALGFAPNTHAALSAKRSDVYSALLDFSQRLSSYGQTRDFPAVKGPSYLGVHLRFGTLSIRQAVRLALHSLHCRSEDLARWSQKTPASASAPERPGSLVWLQELVWRDFYHQVLANFPHVEHQAFKPDYDAIAWEEGPQADALFAAWCEGRTGYPLVDAAQRQLVFSGYMHNRLRMVSASFLVKDLGIDWRRGEAFFAQHLLDFDLASNNGGWQWAASSGCDAQPYFRIFNPWTQSEKFDPQGRFIRRYVPEIAHLSDKAIHRPPAGSYIRPIVEHEQARQRTLLRYAVVKSSSD